MKLFGYWRSSATYRVRIALQLKGLDCDYEPVNLLNGDQNKAEHLARNPQGLVPALMTDDGDLITQSLAIMEYLDDAFPSHPILPRNIAARAHARAIAATIACEAQPFMNLRIQNYLKNEGSFDKDTMSAWLNTWPGGAMAAAEKMVTQYGGKFCVSDEPSIADCCLIPQWFAASRFNIDLSNFPHLAAINERCLAMPAFEKAHPLKQSDAVTS